MSGCSSRPGPLRLHRDLRVAAQSMVQGTSPDARLCMASCSGLRVSLSQEPRRHYASINEHIIITFFLYPGEQGRVPTSNNSRHEDGMKLKL
jgi:hypothetical protein